MNGIFPADLAVYLFLAPVALYIYWSHRWIGWLPWTNLLTFCVVRIVGGAIGVNDSTSIAANIISGIGISPLLLAIDGLLHEARYYRHPEHNVLLGRIVVIAITGLMGAGLGLSISGSLQIYQGQGTTEDLSHWKVGTGLVVAVWAMEVMWALFSLLPSQCNKNAPGYKDGTKACNPVDLMYGALAAIVSTGVRVIYNLVAVCTQRKDPSPVFGSIAVRVVLVFLPEVLAALSMILAGLWSRNICKHNEAAEKYVSISA
ncbi:integral membrane protein [Aspergillus bombycis]|uniref:Integral membrane protein n=1 Tax=Aspergillus bombycis TaxID=109264 RepID=A0A1F7ZZU6_9EURO|nr:integral membrane protein [Aspergillus bombycis]OGM44992.1 integral membrane protein [Aspergillus bombycis]